MQAGASADACRAAEITCMHKIIALQDLPIVCSQPALPCWVVQEIASRLCGCQRSLRAEQLKPLSRYRPLVMLPPLAVSARTSKQGRGRRRHHGPRPPGFGSGSSAAFKLDPRHRPGEVGPPPELEAAMPCAGPAPSPQHWIRPPLEPRVPR
jgi:hypothetical protein